MDVAEIQKLIPELHALIARFEAAAPGRHFTVDGHLVGSIGEVLAADALGSRCPRPALRASMRSLPRADLLR